MVNKLKRHAQTKQEVLSTSIEKQLPLKLARNISSSNYNPACGYNDDTRKIASNFNNNANSYNDDARNVASNYKPASSYNDNTRNIRSSYNGDVYYQQDQVQYQLPFYSNDNKQQVPFQGVDCKCFETCLITSSYVLKTPRYFYCMLVRCY